MGRYLIKRILKGLLTVAISLSITFLIMRCMPSNPADVLVDPMLGPQAVEDMKEKLGLNDPIPVQYFRYVTDLLHGDFGNSFRNGQPVLNTLLPKLKWTLILLLAVQLISIGVGIPVGILAAKKKNKLFDKISNTFIIVCISVFIPFLSFAFLYFFSFKFKLLPTGGAYTPPIRGGMKFVADVARHAVLPTVTLALSNVASVILYTRNAAIDVLREDYIRTAYAKGWGSSYVMRRHALKNAMIPTVTVIGLNIGHMMGGAIMTETVFAWPGIGRLIYESVGKLDYPMLQGAFLILSIAVVAISILTDLAIACIDPRIKLGS
jgi:peptide/nickel transport system permease protein